MSSGTAHDLARERAVRLLDQATRDFVHAAAAMQARGIDTSPLSQPVLMIGDAIRLLSDEAPLDPLSPLNADAPAQQGSLTPGVPSSPHVLLVEDHDDTREMTVHLLKRHGYVVHAFANAEDALRSAPVLKFDVALIDIALPEMDGVDLLHRLRAMRSTMPAVAFTACVMPNDLNRYYLAHFDDVAAKPFDLDKLLATMSRLVHPPTAQDATSGVTVHR